MTQMLHLFYLIQSTCVMISEMQIKNIILTRIVFAIGAVMHGRIKSSIAAEERYSYNESEQGYLFNVGMQKYLCMHYPGENSRIFFASKKQSATKVNIRIIKERFENYAIISSAEDKDVKMCISTYKLLNDGRSEGLLGCPVLQMPEKKLWAEFTRYRRDRGAKFIFSPAIINSLHAFRIYSGDGCLTAQNESLSIRPCEEENTHLKDKQLFIWVRDKIL